MTKFELMKTVQELAGRQLTANEARVVLEYLTERDLGEDFAAGEAIAEEAARRAELIGN